MWRSLESNNTQGRHYLKVRHWMNKIQDGHENFRSQKPGGSRSIRASWAAGNIGYQFYKEGSDEERSIG